MTLRVVVVDDDAAVAALHTKFLDVLDMCEVVSTAGTGPEAVAAIRHHNPDLVLLDIYLPGFSGLEVLRTVRASRHAQPEFIAVTAARDFSSVRDARLQGVRHYLTKPFSAHDLRDRVNEVARELADSRQHSTLDQESIDHFIGSTGVNRTLPKGLNPDTLSAVREALTNSPWSSAKEIGEQVGISRVSSRRYLEYLVTAGVAGRRLDYATSGRPGAQYGPAG